MMNPLSAPVSSMAVSTTRARRSSTSGIELRARKVDSSMPISRKPRTERATSGRESEAEPGLNGTFLMGDETSGSLLHAAVEILFSQRKEHGVSGSSMPCIQSCRDRYLFVNHDYRKSGAQTGDAPELFGPGRSRQRLQIAQVEFRVLKDFFRFAQSRGRHNAVARSLKVFAREDLGLRPQPYEQDVILGRHDC